MQDLTTQSAMIANYNDYAQGIDTKDWALVRSCFSDNVFIDYGELSAASGSPDIARSVDDWLDYLQNVINRFDITRHAITNHRFGVVEGQVSCTAYLVADHVKFADAEVPLVGASDKVTVVGQYTNVYEQVKGRWTICRSALVVHWSEGNLALFAA